MHMGNPDQGYHTDGMFPRLLGHPVCDISAILRGIQPAYVLAPAASLGMWPDKFRGN